MWRRNSSIYLAAILSLPLLIPLTACDPAVTEQVSGTSSNHNYASPTATYQGKPATATTTTLLDKVQSNLPLGDFLDGTLMSEHSNDKLVASFPSNLGTIDFSAFDFVNGPRPESINPSLYNMMRATYKATGVFQVAEDIYQIRGDIAYITLVRGNKGWIILDAGLTKEFSKESWNFAREFLPGGKDVPVSAVIYSHSHADHFGGVKGFVSQADVDSGRVEIIAPYGFMDEALAENVIAGDAMTRRAQYHFGSSLETKSDGTEFSSLGVALKGSIGEFSLITPTRFLPQGHGKLTSLVVDGVTVEFKDISDAEAPASTILYLPKQKTIFNSELMYRGLHNIYTLRGAKVRDALGWSKSINAVIEIWGEQVETMIGPHGPSFSGNEKINEYMKVQRDNYGFLHNQTLRLINNGMKIQDVGQAIEEMIPESLSQVWHTHGYHGTYSHNARGVVNRYIGFYDGNPANLNPLQIKPEAVKYVEYMGGAEKILNRARKDFAAGDYRFVATVLNKLVTAEPNLWPARHLLADAHEQLGYQAESPQWRNAYLTAAKELRTGKIVLPETRGSHRDMLAAATIENLLDSIAVRINGPAAEGKAFTLNLIIPDTQEIFYVELSNSNLSYIAVTKAKEADTTLIIKKGDLLRMMSGQTPVTELISLGTASIAGSPFTLTTLVRLIEKNNKYYEMVPMPTE